MSRYSRRRAACSRISLLFPDIFCRPLPYPSSLRYPRNATPLPNTLGSLGNGAKTLRHHARLHSHRKSLATWMYPYLHPRRKAKVDFPACRETGQKIFLERIRTADFTSPAIILCTLPTELPFTWKGFEPLTAQIST